MIPIAKIADAGSAGQVLGWGPTGQTWVDGGGTGTITAVTAGVGLSGGGSAGAVTIDIDVTAANFPTITIDKGGTGATTAAAARTALGLGSAAVLDAGTADGDVPVLGSGGILASTVLGPTGTTGQVLTRTAAAQEWADALYADSLDVGISGNDLQITIGRTGGLPDLVDSVTLTGGGAGDITSVGAGVGLSGGGDTGAVTLDIDVSAADFPTIPIDKGGTGATDAAAARTALGITMYTDADVDSRLLDRLQNAPQSGPSFFDRVLMWDDTNPNELRIANIGGIRAYTTSNWASPTNNDLFPIAKIASGGAVNQVLGWTASGQEWVDVTGMGVDTNNYTDDATFALVGDQLTLTIGLTGSLADVTSNTITLPSGGGGTGDITGVAAGVGLSGGGDTGDVTVNLNVSGLGLLFPSDLAAADALIVDDDSDPTNPKRVTLAGFTSHITDSSSTVDASNGQIEVASGGITALELANDAVTEPKLAVSNAPSANQVLGWDGAALTWAGVQNYYPIPDADVGGTANAITLTSGQSLSAYVNGMMFFFSSNETNTGTVTVDVDGIGTMEIGRSSGQGSGAPLTGGEITANDPILIVYGTEFNTFYFIPGHQGMAAQRNVGTAEHELPILGTGGILPSSVLAAAGTDGQVLTRTATGQAWEDATGMGGGLLTIAHDTAFGGDGTSGDPLTLAVAGADFPIITLAKGGTGAATVDAARTNLGLGSAALRNVGDAATNVAVLQADASFIASHLAPGGTDTQVLTRTATGKEWADATGMGGGLLTVATDTAFGGDGTSGDPLTLAVAGAAFPTITIDKGGTGATDAAGARSAFGLGTAATRDAGDQQFNVGVLQADGAFSFGRLAPGGTDGQVLTRTATGKEWADATGMGGGLTTVASDATLSGDGTSGSPLGVADDSITTLQLADSAVRTVNLGLLSVHGVQIADDTITEPKLNASNDPATGQVLGWDGSDLTWAAPNGTGRTFIVPRSGVSGTGTDVALTTGQSLTAYELGDRFQFRMENTPTGSMSIAVDGLPAIQLTKGGTFGDLRAGVGDVRLNDGIIATYLDPEGNGQARFWLSYLAVGNAARRSVGSYASAIPELDADAKLVQSTLGGTTVSDGDYLSAVGGSQEWVSPARNGGLRVGNVASMSPVIINSTVNVAHGLGRDPEFVNAFLECITADLGYDPGDMVSAFNYNRTVSGADDTNVWVSTEQSTLPYIVNKSGGDDLEITGSSWRFTAVPYIIEGAASLANRYTIPDANVGGTANAITLTTGASLSSVPWGTYIFFRANLSNTGSVTVDVDGIGIAFIARGSQLGASVLLTVDDIRLGEEYILIKDFDDTYTIRPFFLSRAAWYDVGIIEDTLAVLGPGGVFDSGRLAASGADGQVLTRTATGQEWADATGGGTNNFVEDATLALSGSDLTLTLGRDGLGDVVSNVLTLPTTGGGDITSVSVGAGLSGGGTSGDVSINLNLVGLPNYPGSMNSFDRVIVLDQSDSNLPKDIIIDDFSNYVATRMRLDLITLESLIAPSDNFVFADATLGGFPRRVTWGGAVARIADQDTLVTANAIMRIADEGVQRSSSERYQRAHHRPGTFRCRRWPVYLD